MTIKNISYLLITLVIACVILYGAALIFFTWPIDELSINKSGVFGDSFGLLTSLFSGLAFAGIIITILLQKEELELQRKELIETKNEFKKSAEAQEVNAKLNALSNLLTVYKQRIETNDETLQRKLLEGSDNDIKPLVKESFEYIIKRKELISELEAIVKKSGIDI